MVKETPYNKIVLAIKGNELSMHAVIWMTIKCIFQVKGLDPKGCLLSDSIYVIFWKDKNIGVENRWMVRCGKTGRLYNSTFYYIDYGGGHSYTHFFKKKSILAVKQKINFTI